MGSNFLLLKLLEAFRKIRCAGMHYNLNSNLNSSVFDVLLLFSFVIAP
jgi:hypothetical protein